MKDSKRQRQFSSLLQKELSEIFQRNASSLLGTSDFVTVSRVLVSPDLGVARIYLSFMLSKQKEQLMDTIQYKKSEIRRLLGNRIGKVARIVPELVFYRMIVPIMLPAWTKLFPTWIFRLLMKKKERRIEKENQ